MLYAFATPFRAFFPDRGWSAAPKIRPFCSWRQASLVIAFCALITGLFSPCSADVPLNATARAELQQWSNHFWTRVQTGQPAAASTTFTFTDTRLNSPLVAPVRGAVRWLQRLQPAVRYQADNPAMGTVGGVSWNEVRDLMRCGWLASDLSVDPDRAWTHILVAYENGSPEAIEFSGTIIQSVNLYPIPIDPDVGGGDPPPPVAADEAAFLLALVPHAAAISAGIDTSAERMRDALLNRTPYWDEFAASLHHHILHTSTPLPTQVSFLSAAFGDGVLSLTTVCVQAGHAYILIDPLTGQVAGPFHESAPINARSLLAGHPDQYTATDRVEYVGEDGAVMVYVTPIGGPNPYPPPPNGAAYSCFGCIACISAVTASCAVLCAEQPWWDAPGEGFNTCVTKCSMAALGIPLDLLPAIRGDVPFDPGDLSITACNLVCTGCGGRIIAYLRRWSMLSPIGTLQPATGWVGGPSSCQ
jgi:hypothetical protein